MKRPLSIPTVTAAALGQQPILAEGCLVAVSGGPDSVGLLHAVVECFRSQGATAPLVVGHLNHGLRGQESDGDEAFVRQVFAGLAAQPGNPQLKLACTRLEVRHDAQALHENLEALARKLRYAWLTEQARLHDVRWVLTAHTLDDQAETTLFHILRGTGIRGLRAMRPVRRLASDVWLVRPWLKIHKAGVLDYLKERGFSFRTDSSNLDKQFARNRIRHDLMPRLQADYNGRVVDALAGLANRANLACHLLDRQARKTLTKIERPRVGHMLVLAMPDIQKLSIEVLQSLYAYLWRREDWPRGNMGFREWDRLAHWTKTASKAIELPDGIQAVKKRLVVQLGPCK